MKLTIGGNSLPPLSPRRVVAKFLDTLPDGELIETKELAEKTGVSIVNAALFRRDKTLQAYGCGVHLPQSVHATTLWGNVRTVKELRRKLNENQ